MANRKKLKSKKAIYRKKKKMGVVLIKFLTKNPFVSKCGKINDDFVDYTSPQKSHFAAEI